MPTKILRDPSHFDALANLLRGVKLPVVVSWSKGDSRSQAANRLSHRWYADISRQMGDRTTEDVRAECKLEFGVPILCAEDEGFRAEWGGTFGALSWQRQLAAMKAFQLPVTSLMSSKQMSAYMNEIQREWTQRGVRLTSPDDLKYEQEFE